MSATRGRFEPLCTASASTAEDAASLPSWIYRDADFFELEKHRIFRSSWQIVCHSSDIPVPGDYHCLDFLGESLLALRGDDGQIRSFHNVCRHRAARLLDGPVGHCRHRITCPYHAWSYGLDGSLLGVPQRDSFAHLDMRQFGLVELEQEIFLGFVFVRLAPGLPSVREMAAPYVEELQLYRLEQLRAQQRASLRTRAVNWKNVTDNYSDGLHVHVAHPGLDRLFGHSYQVEAREWIDRMAGMLRAHPSSNWSERAYQNFLPPVAHLPQDRQKQWLYFKLWPNIAFDIYPDQIDFMQILPLSATQTLIREVAYAHPDTRREMRVTRYLNRRINREVSLQDKALIERVQSGMASSSYHTGPLGEAEVCLRSFARRMRALLPECRSEQQG